MNIKTQDSDTQTYLNWRALVLLSLLILIAYSNTFNASWHLDDFHNITQNPRIKADSLYPESLYTATFENTGDNTVFSRPIAFLSLTVNWYFGKADVTGYHIVNIVIHILTAFFLYLSVLALFKTPNLARRYIGNEYFIAVLAAVLWAANPIQTQAVTYIVQRMASMAAMFYVLGIYLYIKARIATLWKSRALLYTGVALAFLLAVGSKENALMFPVALFLVEMVFFRDLGDPRHRKRFIWLGCILAVALFALGVLLFMKNGFITRLQEGYANRTFTLTERLLTEPRIVVFYLSQIFYPIADRLSITHDIKVSTGLFHPWTSLPAILFILGLVAAAFWKIKRYPLLSFAILFFFLNHVIESSIIPLELVFEHRNYLPSLFLFVPIAAGLKWIIDYYAKEKRSMAHVLTAFATILVMVLGIGTYVRNMAWANEKILWQDAMEKAPKKARPYHNLAVNYYAKVKNYSKVIELCEKAKDLRSNTKVMAEVLSLENLAYAYAMRDKDYAKAIKLYKQALKIKPNRVKSNYYLVLALIHSGRLEEALKESKNLLSQQPENFEYLNTKAFILLKRKQPEKAMSYLIKAIKKSPDSPKTLLNLGLAKLMIGNYNSAKHFLDRISSESPKKTKALFLLIENSVRAGKKESAKKYAEKLIARTSPETIRKELKEANEPSLEWPVSEDLVAPVIAEVIREQSDKISSLANADQG